MKLGNKKSSQSFFNGANASVGISLDQYSVQTAVEWKERPSGSC